MRSPFINMIANPWLYNITSFIYSAKDKFVKPVTVDLISFISWSF